MSSLRRFKLCDLFRLSCANLDFLTENYQISYYGQYLAAWPNCFVLAEQRGANSVGRSPGDSSTMICPNSRVVGYIMGKVEGAGQDWHGHVSALSVGPEFRRLGLAEVLMNSLETISDSCYRAYFVDLYVRKSNSLAIAMYKKFGYIRYREVINYYSGEENAFDMRKALKRDPDKKSMIPIKNPVHPDPNWD